MYRRLVSTNSSHYVSSHAVQTAVINTPLPAQTSQSNWSLEVPLANDTWGADILSQISNISESTAAVSEATGGIVISGSTVAGDIEASTTANNDLPEIPTLRTPDVNNNLYASDNTAEDTDTANEPTDENVGESGVVVPQVIVRVSSMLSITILICSFQELAEAPVTEPVNDSPLTPPVPCITVTSASSASFNNLMALAAARPSTVLDDGIYLTPPPSIMSRRSNCSSKKSSRPRPSVDSVRTDTSVYFIKDILNDLNASAKRPSLKQRLQRGGSSNSKSSRRMADFWEFMRLIVVPKPQLPSYARPRRHD